MAFYQATTAGFRARLFVPRFPPWVAAFCLCGTGLLSGFVSICFAETSEIAPLAAQALLLDVAAAGDRLVAVGDHGDVVVSRDAGRTWTQVLVPTRALLTGICFADAEHGWAVGHQGVILHTADGGQTWQRQDDGKHPDDVYLDVLFRDALHGFVVGAYGRFFTTMDGGKTWTAGKPTGDEVHYNRISAGPDGHLYLSGESGTTLVSTDGGVKWTRSEVPYDGSLFGVLPLETGRLVTYGLRGHILRSEDNGVTWIPINNDVSVLIMGGIRMRNGTIVLTGQGGNFFISRNAGLTFKPWRLDAFETSVADLIETSDGAILTVGEAGAVRLKVP